jgi:hypothetical protein
MHSNGTRAVRVCSTEQPFALIANGQKVMVTCPPNVRPGQKIRFQLPIQLSQQQLETFKVSYDKDGWMRCLGMVSCSPARGICWCCCPYSSYAKRVLCSILWRYL